MSHPPAFFRLFGNCIPVKGAIRSMIYDLQLGRMRPIPNELYEMLTTLDDQSIAQIKAHHHHQYDEEIDGYFSFLETHEWGFFTDEPERWPQIPLDYHHHAAITNAVIDLDRHSDYDVKDVIDQLQSLGCSAVQVRLFTAFSPVQLRALMDLFEDSIFRTVDLLAGYHPELNETAAKALCLDYLRICQLQIHSAPFSKGLRSNEKQPSMGLVMYTTESVTSHHHCGVVEQGYMSVSTLMFTESLHYNNCLHRKISVNHLGEIKNCPSMTRSFGHIDTHSLSEALAADDFREYWTVTKDQIEVCKDCEFRYACPDCRVFISGPGADRAKPTKCSYDPYTGTWASSEVHTFMEV